MYKNNLNTYKYDKKQNETPVAYKTTEITA